MTLIEGAKGSDYKTIFNNKLENMRKQYYSYMKNYQKFQEIVQMTEAQINVIENAQMYLNIDILERELHRKYKKLSKSMEKGGKKGFHFKTTRDGTYTSTDGKKRRLKGDSGKIYEVIKNNISTIFIFSANGI